MLTHFPQAVPEIPVSNIDQAAEYYVNVLGFSFDSRQWRTNRGTCVSSGSRIWTAICCVCSTTSTGK